MGSVDKTLFLLKHGKDLMIFQIYVEDIIFGDSSHALCSKFSEQMSREFEMSMQTPQGTFVHQSKYTRDLLQKFEMADASPQMTPMSTSTTLDADEDGKEVDQKVYRGMIGSLLYLTATRLDIQFAVGIPEGVSRTAVKRILRYIKFTPEFGLWYSADSSLSPLAFRIRIMLDTSTCEAEYVAAASCCSQILWMLATLRDYGRIPILCDSSSAISVAKNPVLHSRTKHIDVRYHFLRDNYEKGYDRYSESAKGSWSFSMLFGPAVSSLCLFLEELVIGEGVDKALINGEIEGLKCTESGLSSWL
ncbi:hypothetical protein U9M48_043612 [Paspalum notatum var. saurae]|uniref:Reverse transcriptase Ty1/copia-type domain-containing protein n=1 Tax=Paspalum notatum var. saurae TaxID=547442 RepID=A0AAQ3XHA9_PASNO